MKCAICNLPTRDRQRIDRELLEQTASLGQIALRIGCHKTSVKRHADRHLKPAVTAEIQRIEGKQDLVPEPITTAVGRRAEAPDIRKGVRPVIERLYERCADWADRAQDD